MEKPPQRPRADCRQPRAVLYLAPVGPVRYICAACERQVVNEENR